MDEKAVIPDGNGSGKAYGFVAVVVCFIYFVYFRKLPEGAIYPRLSAKREVGKHWPA